MSPARSATYTVNNATDFNNLPRLNAGDVVQMNSGTYGAINKTLESSIADDTTAKNSPILVYALTPGGVLIDAPSKIILSGRGITLAGLDFGPNSGIMSGSSYMVATASASRYMTLSNLRFNGCAGGATDGHWLYIQGFYCAVEFCTFTERPNTSSNSTISFMPNVSEGGVTVPRLHRLSYCYFGPRYVGTVNGFEAIRIGVGDAQTFDMQVTIEHNLFYRSIWRSDLSAGGEPEIISNKSKGNKILNNTILESQGGICLRSGDGATVEGNFIFGAGTITNGTNIVLGTTLASQNGIRVIGKDHVIRNNYIENITGTDIHAALCLMSGESDYNPGNPATGATNNGSYAPAHNAKVYNNTFVNCYELSLGFLSNDSYTNSSGAYVAKSPTNVLFYNNAWQGNGRAAAAVARDTSAVTGYTPIVLGGSGANYFYETSSSKFGWTNGISNSTFSAVTNAAVSSNFDNYKVPTSTSPLLNKATNTLVAAYDVRALARPTNNQDIGCFEREVAGSGYKPLLRTNVGTGFDGGPTNSYPTPGSGDSKPTILTASLPGGALTVAYSQTLLASGGDGALTWSITSGSLPAGLTLLPGSGLISGTPTASGSFTFTIRVTDSDAVGPDYAEKSLTISISSGSSVKLTINTSKAFSSSGTKPADSHDGKTSTRWSSSVTSKNPATNGTNFGTDCTWIWWDLGENKNLSSVRLNWYNGGSRTDSYRIDSGTNTNNWTTILNRNNSRLTNGYETVNFSAASGRYVRLVSWGNSTSNGFTGINEVEIYGSTYVAPDTRKTQSIIFGDLPSVSQTDPPIALAAYSLDTSNNSTGLPITYDSSDTSVATLDGSTVSISGAGSTWITATQPGDANFQAAAPVQQLLSVTSVSPDITSATSATAVRGLPFRYQITAVRSPFNFGASNLPPGLSVDAFTGKISGTPTASGLFSVTLTAENSAGTGSTNLNLNVVEPYVYETFETYTNGVAVPLVSPSSIPSGIKASGQVTNAAGNSTIGGTNGKVAWFNDTGTNASAQIEFNAGASGQSYLAASFELLNNAAPSNSGTMPLTVALAAWNAGNTTAGGSSGKRIASAEFNQFGSLTTPAWSVKGATTNNFTYVLTNKQTVHIFANDHDSNTINYVGPDGNVRTLSTNSLAVFMNSAYIGMYGLNLAAVANDGTTVLTGNNNLGRLCFNTTSGNTGNWLIDNVVVSDMPTDVAIPAPAAPIITSATNASGQAGFAFSYQTTCSELADSFVCDGTLPSNVAFNTSTGLISGTPNQSGVFPVTIYAVNSAGTGSLDLVINIAAAPPNIFSGSDPSLNTTASWSLGAAPNASSSGGSYTDLVFNSAATNLTTSSGNINGKSWNVTNGSVYTLSSVRTNLDSGTLYKIGSTGLTETNFFTNTVTGVTNEMVFLANNSTLTLSPLSISNSNAASAQLRNSGSLRIESGSTLNIPCSITESTAGTSIRKTGAGRLSLSGSNSYTGATTLEAGVLALGGSNASAVTVRSNAILEIALASPGTAASILSSPLSLEPGSKVRIVGTPISGSNYTLVAATAVNNNATLEVAVSGFQLTTSGNSLLLVPAGLATPVITWSNPAAITYGTALSSAQLNATSSVTGTYAYTPTNGAVLPAGTNTLQVIFSAADTNSYLSPVTNSVSLIVNKATPAINAAPSASAISYGQTLADSILSGGSTSVAGTFAFTAPGTAPGAGTASQPVTFTPVDTANYSTVMTNVSVTVNKATAAITWANPAPI
ncbi:MAG: chondroitinase-B domain-containing protein, partial [Sphaerospermopsis kisseleviana]